MKLCQLEFQSQNPEASQRFLEKVLGWQKVPVSLGDQIILSVPEDSPYGVSIRQALVSDDSKGLLAYFESRISLDEVKTAVLANGGAVFQEPKPIVGYGTVLGICDGYGIRLGLFYSN